MWRFSHKFRQKTLEVWYKVSLSKTSSGNFVAWPTTYRTVSTIWQDMTPFPESLGLKAPTPNRRDVRFMVHGAYLNYAPDKNPKYRSVDIVALRYVVLRCTARCGLSYHIFSKNLFLHRHPRPSTGLISRISGCFCFVLLNSFFFLVLISFIF